MNVKSQGTESGLGRAPRGGGARTVADWMWPFLLGGGALFSISALFYYHFNRVELEPRSFLQVAFAGLYDNFGWAPTVVFFLLVFAWSLIWFVTGVLERPVSRLVRLLVMAVMLGVFLNLGDGGVVREPHKGAFGAWLAGRLVSAVGYLPSLVVVLFTTFASLLLATDWFFSDWFDRSRRPEDAEKGVEEAVTDHLRALADESLAAPEGAGAAAPAVSAVPEVLAQEATGAGRADLLEAAAQDDDSVGDDGDGADEGDAEDEGDYADEGQQGDDEAAAAEVEGGERLIVLDPSEQEPDEIQLEVDAPATASLDAMSDVADDEDEIDEEVEDEEVDDEEIGDDEFDDDEFDDEEIDDEEDDEELVDDAWSEDEQEGGAEVDEDADEVEADESFEADEHDEAPEEDALVEAGDEAEGAVEEDLAVASADVEADQVPDEGEECAAEPADAVAIPRPDEPIQGGTPAPPVVASQHDRGRQQNLFGVGVDEALVQEASELLSSGRRPSASLLQRKLRIDYDLAQELLRELVARGLLTAEPRP